MEYVKDEYRAKKGKELDVTKWELVSCAKDTPRQRNGEFVFLGARLRLTCLPALFRILHSNILFLNLGYDCGAFICMFADFISKDCRLLFNQDHIDKCRDRIALSIMRNCAIDDSYSQAAVATVTLSNTLAAQPQLLADFGELSSKASTMTEDYLHKKLRFYLLKGLDRWICTSCRVEVSSLLATCQLCKSYIPFVPLTCAEFENFAMNMGWGMPHWGNESTGRVVSRSMKTRLQARKDSDRT